MEKRLTVVGNSLALVIDKPIREVLGIARTTRLRVSLEGPRIVVEPIRDTGPRPEPKDRVQLMSFKTRRAAALKAHDELFDTWGLTVEHLKQLGYRRTWCPYRDLLKTAPDDLGLQPTMDRLTICLEALHVGRSWEEAIKSAQLIVPDPYAEKPRSAATADPNAHDDRDNPVPDNRDEVAGSADEARS
jgi:hypothetical protein